PHAGDVLRSAAARSVPVGGVGGAAAAVPGGRTGPALLAGGIQRRRRRQVGADLPPEWLPFHPPRGKAQRAAFVEASVNRSARQGRQAAVLPGLLPDELLVRLQTCKL